MILPFRRPPRYDDVHMRAAPFLAAWALLAALPPAVLDDPIADLDIYNPHHTAVATAVGLPILPILGARVDY